jgi:hypothetical protein
MRTLISHRLLGLRLDCCDASGVASFRRTFLPTQWIARGAHERRPDARQRRPRHHDLRRAGSKGHEPCRIDIHIDTKGPVNIFNCSSALPAAEPPTQPSPPPSRYGCEPISPGQCVPLAIGAKPKQSLRTKLDALLANTEVPSAVAAGFFQHARRFAAGRPAATALETQVFDLFRSMPPEQKAILSCSVASFDGIKREERDRLFDAAISQNVDSPLDAETLATAFVRELTSRVGSQVFGDVLALDQERPGATGSSTPPAPRVSKSSCASAPSMGCAPTNSRRRSIPAITCHRRCSSTARRSWSMARRS